MNLDLAETRGDRAAAAGGEADVAAPRFAEGPARYAGAAPRCCAVPGAGACESCTNGVLDLSLIHI